MKNSAQHTHYSFLENILYSNSKETDQRVLQQFLYINAFSFACFFAIVFFGTLQLLGKNYIAAIPDAIEASILLFNIFLLRIHKNLTLSKIILLVSQVALLLIILGHGGIANTGIFWYFTFPIMAYFLFGKKAGSIWVAGVCFATLCAEWLVSFSVISIPFSRTEVILLIIMVCFISALIYIYQSTLEFIEERLEKNRIELQEYLDNMTTFTAKVDTNGKILVANKGAKDVSGLGDALIGSNFRDGPWWLPDKTVQKQIVESFEKAVAGKKVVYEQKIKTHEGILPIIITLVPVIHKNKIEYILAEGKDVSAVRQAEENLQKQKDDLEKLNKFMVDRELKMVALKKQLKDIST